MAIVTIAIIIFIFTILFVIFAYSNKQQNIGYWVLLVILFSLILGSATSFDSDPQRLHPSYLIGQYFKYNRPYPITNQ